MVNLFKTFTLKQSDKKGLKGPMQNFIHVCLYPVSKPSKIGKSL